MYSLKKFAYSQLHNIQKQLTSEFKDTIWCKYQQPRSISNKGPGILPPIIAASKFEKG